MTGEALASAPRRAAGAAAWLVIGAGVCAALHVGKLPPAISALQRELGLTLVQAGFMLSLVQFAGMIAGAGFGAVADGLGLRRSMIVGLATLSAASLTGGFARGAAALMLLRAIEGFGFLLVALPAPGLLRRLVEPRRLAAALGVWGAYMPLGTALALLAGPGAIALAGWSSWWWALAALSAVMAFAVAAGVPPDGVPANDRAAPWLVRFAATLRAPGPWLAALSFSVYSSQWLAVIGFLPTIYLAAGVSNALTGMLTAFAAAVNIVGNVGAGRLLQRGVAPQRLLVAGFATMGLATVLAFAPPADAPGWAPLRYGAVLLFSSVGGIVPGTLFTLAVRLAPGEAAVSTTIGWVQQWSSFGQFVGPPLVAWLAARVGSWQWTWLVTGACAVAGLLLSRPIVRRLDRMPHDN